MAESDGRGSSPPDTKIGGAPLAQNEILYIESKLGWKLGDVGVERAARLRSLGASLDEIVEAITLL